MSDDSRRITDGSSSEVATNYDANVDYVITEYMERLGTRLNILETELKYAWRALDLLSQEYIKMWERLEKLEGLLYEQQSVISQLLDFYTSGNSTSMNSGAVALLDGRLGELEVIREILGNGVIEDGLEEGLDVTSHTQTAIIQELDLESADGFNAPDEAFYRSLNQAYREDLVGDPNVQSSQLGLIWEEREDEEEKKEFKELSSAMETQEVYSALDYKDYRGNSPCISEQDLEQLSRIASIDHATMEKLNELDRLSSKLQQDSANIKHLQRKLMESPIPTDDNKSKDKIMSWSFSSNARDQDEMMLLAQSDLPSSLSNLQYPRPSSRLSITDSLIGNDSEVAETLAGGLSPTSTSPRRRTIELNTCSAPFTTVTGRLAYSNAVQHVESVEAAAALRHSKNPFFSSNVELNNLIAATYETIASSTPAIFSIKSEKAQSPTLSICSIRTRQDGYINKPGDETLICLSPPPPPAPNGLSSSHIVNTGDTSQVFLGTADAVLSSSITHRGPGRLSPKSPKSPKTSPKRHKSHSSHSVTAKSDSGLSSMSGWSSLEKSPGSPKTNQVSRSQPIQYYTDNTMRHTSYDMYQLQTSPLLQNRNLDNRVYLETDTDTKLLVPDQSSNVLLPGGHHLSAFTTVKSPCSLESTEGYGNFVPAPAPASDINVSPRKKPKHTTTKASSFGEYVYRSDLPTIYSVAGSNNHSYTSVYTSNSADYISQTIHYPDLVEPYENNEFQRNYSYNAFTTTDYPDNSGTSHTRRKSLPKIQSNPVADGVANHEGYKTAMYRTMFPSGNITDALSYYPTSTRYDTMPQHFANPVYDNQSWNYQQHEMAKSNVPQNNDLKYQQSEQVYEKQYSEQPIYENQEQIDEHNRMMMQRQEMPYLELDLRNRNVPEYAVPSKPDNSKHDHNNVVVTQAGFVSIPQNTVSTAGKDDKKKFKRGNTLKTAMNSVSHWLPDLHLHKRHRSYSLPSGVQRQDIEKTKSSFLKTNSGAKKKKKNAIVSTVSGILQKAKRKAYNQHSTHSLSDPEQSENEWVLNRTHSVVSVEDQSEDSYSLVSDNVMEKDLFAKISAPSKPINRRNSQPNSNPFTEDNHEDQLSVPPLEDMSISPQTSDIFQNETDTELQNINEEMGSGKSTGSGTSSIFQTVGENKRSSGSSEKSDDTIITESKMKVPVCGSSMEFAVSRALGKYRQRQSSNSDDQIYNDEHSIYIEEYVEDEDETFSKKNLNKIDKINTLIAQKSSESQLSEESKFNENELPPCEGSPSATSLRSHFTRFLPRHQQSLDIPHRDDDDSRSTHSWRSTSRVSSRRQSTEDSIDSEDEWYCYELKKLEEMERQSQLEADFGEPLHEEEEPEEEPFEPTPDVRQNMNFVLRELRMKARVVEGVLDEKENNLHAVQSAKRRSSSRLSAEFSQSIFAKMRDYHHPPEPDEPKELDLLRVEDEHSHSSGDTSGPDSPHQSTDEYEENEIAMNDSFARCVAAKLPPTKEETKPALSEIDVTKNVPKIKVEESSNAKEENAKDVGPMGSKWKLLKTLKERKAEEKSNQEKASTPVDKDKVSMLGIMQKLYEIHVKT